MFGQQEKQQSPVVQWSIAGLLFVLGVVVGHRYIKPGQIPFLPTPNYLETSQTRVINTDNPGQYRDVDFQQFWEVWQLLQTDYIDSSQLDQEQMVYGAIQGMTAAVGDPYTMYLPPVEDKRAEEELAGSFYGIGIELGYIDGTLAVVSPLKGMPAEQKGVQAGDLILHARDDQKGLDEDAANWSLDEAVNKIRGEKGTEITLTLYRKNNGAEPFDVSIPRGEIVIPSVELAFVEHDGKRAAHIQLSRFGERTQAEWNDVVTQILAQGDSVDLVLLDMRNNPGGFFDGAIMVASEFVKSGTIVSQQGKYITKDYPVEGKARLADLPLKILVNRGSASASEIVAGALRDLKDTPLIGEKTFGKGTVQDRKQLPDGGGIHITVARWLLPEGDWIDHDGLPVDVEVSDDLETEQDEVVLKALEN
jgi:carboxyl-terminal processing protease